MNASARQAVAGRPIAPAAALAPPKLLARTRLEQDILEQDMAGASHALPAPPLDARDIRDDDATRAQLTRWLVHDLAPRLGLDPASVRISTDAAAGARVEAHGASGLSTPARIYLHPRRFQPGTVDGRALLAHELVHAAQRHLTAAPLARARGQRGAEEEAERIARAYASGHAVALPQMALAPDALAFDTGAQEPTPALADSVLASRSREIAQIKRYLSGWWISDGDVANIMEILDSVAWPVASAMLMALGSNQRYQLADNINAPHVLKHRRSVLVAYASLTPQQVDAIDLDVVRTLQPGGMSGDEKDATATLLQKLGDKVRRKLLAEDRAHAAGLIALPQLSEIEKARKVEDDKKAAVEEAGLARERRAILQHEQEPALADLLEQVRAALQRNDTGGAVEALDLLTGARLDASRLAFAGERMEQQGLLDSMLELLPPSSYFDNQQHTETIVALVRARLPFKNTRLVEELLSYGLFDWAITDTEALFAYLIIQSLPQSEQLRFRRRDGGKWYLRLLDNLPRDGGGARRPGLEIRQADGPAEVARLEAEGFVVDKKTSLYNASERYARKLQESGAGNALAELVAAFGQARKGIYRDHEARELYLRLVALGAGSLAAGHEAPADQLLREAVVRELDNLGYIDELFGELPESFLYAEEHRVSTVKIMLAREAARLQHHARELVSRGFTDWMVTDHEAWLAFMCVKALPDTEREDFISTQPDKWRTIQSEMSAAQRQASDLNAYIGDRAGVDRASVLGQLAEASLWRPNQLLTLDGLLHMALAMSEHRFAFARSEEFKAVQVPGLEGVVEKYRLWNPAAGRKDYDPAILQGTHWYEEGPFATLKAVGNGLVTLWNMDLLYVDGKVGARVDLGDVQDLMGGDLAGAHLATPGKKERASHPDANKLTLLVGADARSAELILPELLIDMANMQFGGTTLQTGAVTIKDLRLHASYNDDTLGQPTQAHVVLGSLVANDLLLATSSSMIAIARLGLQALRIASGAVDSVTGAATANRKPGSLPFPLLVLPLLPLLMLLALPLYLLNKITGFADKFTGIGEKMPAEMAPRTKALDFSFSSLAADGVSTSAGQQVARVAVSDVAVRVGLTRATRLRAERASIDARLTRLQGQGAASAASTELAARRKVVDDALVKVTADEQEYLAIQKKILAGGLDGATQDVLQQRLNQLKFDESGAAFIDIGAIEASGVAGNVSAEGPIRLSGIHGEGGGSALNDLLAAPAATDKELSRRSGAGERPPPLDAAASGSNLALTLDDVSTGQISIGGGLRTVAAIDAQLKELAPQQALAEVAPLFESLQLLRVKAERFERLVEHGVGSLNAAQLAEFRALRQQLAAQADLVLKSIAITRLQLDVDIASGRIRMGAQAASIAGIQMPAQGLEIDQVIVRGLGVEAVPQGGLLNWADWKNTLRDASGHVDSLEVSGVRDRMHGLLFEKATLTGAYAGIRERGNTVTAGLARLQLTGIGIVPRIGLLRRRLAGLEQKAKLATGPEQAKVNTEIATLSAKLAELDQLAAARVSAYRNLQTARTPAEVAAAKDAVRETDMTIVLGLAQYGASEVALDEFGVELSGAGDLLTDAFGSGIDADTVLRRGVRVRGTGAKGMLLRGLTVKGANTRSDSNDASLEASGNLALGETRLDVQVQRNGDTATIDLASFDIAAFGLSEFLLTTDDAGVGMQVGSSGASSIEGLHLDGEVRLVKRTAVKGEGSFPGDFRLAQVNIRNFRIDKVSANGLLYRSIPDQIEARINSGAIGGIWASGLTLRYPEAEGGKPVVLGQAGVERITDLEIGGAIADGIELQRGRLNGKDLRVDFLEEGALHATVGDFSATAMALRGPDGWARFSLNHLSGAIGMKKGVVTLDQVKLGSLEVPGVDWRAGSRRVTADKPARLVDLRVSAQVATRQEPPAAGVATEAKTVIDSLRIHQLSIGAVSAQHLVYHDGDDEVEIGAPPAGLPAAMRAFRPLFISDIRVNNLEWDPARGVGGNKLEANVGGFEASAVYRNLKQGVSAGVALKGSDMGLSFIGPNFIVGNSGIIAKTAGFYKDDQLSTSFATGQIVGSYTLTDKGVTVHNLEFDKIEIGHTQYNAPGMQVELGGAGASHLSVGRIDVDFEKGVDDKGKPAKKLKEIRVDDIVMTGLHADSFQYTGMAVSKDDSGKEVIKETDLLAQRAWIDRFQVHTLRHDVANRLTTVERAAIDNRRGERPAFGVQGLVANLATTIGNKTSAVRLATDIEGSALTGQDISFQSVKVGAKKVPGQPEQEITRSAIGGKFQLNRLALLHPNVVLTDAQGQKTVIRDSRGPDRSRVVVTGIKPTLNPNGTMVLPFDQLRAENFLIERGGIKVTLPLLQLKDFAMALKGGGSKEGFSLLAAKLRQLSVHDVTMEMTVDRAAPDAPKADADDDKDKKPGPALFIEPLGDLQGELRGEADWVIAPGLTIPVRDGKINFEHVHPFAVNLSRGHVAVGRFRALEVNVADIPMLPGMHPEQGEYGVIDLRELLEHLVNDPAAPADPDKAKKPPADLSALKNVAVRGQLKLGNGRIGVDANRSGGADEGDTFAQLESERASDNRIELPSANAGDEINVNIARLRASRLKIAGGADYPSGQTGEATVSGINIKVTGLANMAFTIKVTVKEGKIVDIQFGDVSLFQQDGRGNYQNLLDLPPPTMAEVSPEPKLAPAAAKAAP